VCVLQCVCGEDREREGQLVRFKSTSGWCMECRGVCVCVCATETKILFLTLSPVGVVLCLTSSLAPPTAKPLQPISKLHVCVRACACVCVRVRACACVRVVQVTRREPGTLTLCRHGC